MMHLAKKLIAVLFTAVFLFCSSMTVSADELRAGSVAGLPEKLVVLDDNGNSVSERGEYFFEVEDMTPGEEYTKNIQIMNLWEDASYHIYFNAQPMTKYGDIDLEEECVLTLYIDDRVVYTGKVTGEGVPDVRDEPLDLGRYGPGESRVLRAVIVWNNTGNAGGDIDEGHRIYDFNGVKLVRGKTGKTHIEGEVIFKWIFTAEVDIPSDDQSSGSYIHTGETITFIFFGLVIVTMIVMLLLVLFRRKKQENK